MTRLGALLLLVLIGCVGGPLYRPDASVPSEAGVPAPDAQPSPTDSGPVVVADLGTPAPDSGPPPAPDLGSAPDAGPTDVGPITNPIDGVMGTPEVIASGYQFTEGPAWYQGSLLFSDIPADTVYRWQPGGGVSVFRSPSNNTNGMAVGPRGELYAAEHGGRRLTVLRSGSTEWETVTDRYEGQRYNSPNDIAVRSDGWVYFTDPEWGIIDNLAARELNFNGLFRYQQDTRRGDLEWQADWVGHPNTPRPNGLVFSPDEETLYMADDQNDRLIVFRVREDAQLDQRMEWSTGPTPDGMTVDSEGNVYVATESGVEVYSPSARLWGTISLPNGASNVTFGGSDGRDLFVTAGGDVYRVRMSIAGQP